MFTIIKAKELSYQEVGKLITIRPLTENNTSIFITDKCVGIEINSEHVRVLLENCAPRYTGDFFDRDKAYVFILDLDSDVDVFLTQIAM